jgi:hypothetical protein
MGVSEGAFLLPILQKQHHPSALQRINCTLADFQLQKAWGKQPTGTEQGSLYCLV